MDNKINRIKIFIIISLILLIGNKVFSEDLDSLVFKVEFLYNQGQYLQVVDNVEKILQSRSNLAESLLVRLYTYQAFAYVALSRREDALNAFRYLLILKPNLDLDPKFVSPKIIEIFEESKRTKSDTFTAKSIYTPRDLIGARDKTIKQKALRSLMYPGLGQLYDNKKTLGYIFIGSETASLVGLVVSHILTNAAHKQYLDARNQTDIDKYYQNYAFWYQVRLGFCISSVSIWLINYLNITLSD